jgi:hypothetical protein
MAVQKPPVRQNPDFALRFFDQAPTRIGLLAAAAILLTIGPAAARPRDDVISGMFRCATIGDTRLWLDCYYGAAQTMRAQLGMVPAPANQVRLAQNPPASAPAGDLSPRYQVTADALRCNSVAEDRPWLNCYYAAAQPVRAQLGLTPAPQAAAPLPALASVQPGMAPAQPAALPQGWSPMQSYSFDRFGMFTVVLANGQQWRQLSGDTNLAHWTKPAASYQVRITHGALRSLNLHVKGEPAAFKVEQVN